jgi:hypothetical protein
MDRIPTCAASTSPVRVRGIYDDQVSGRPEQHEHVVHGALAVAAVVVEELNEVMPFGLPSTTAAAS